MILDTGDRSARTRAAQIAWNDGPSLAKLVVLVLPRVYEYKLQESSKLGFLPCLQPVLTSFIAVVRNQKVQEGAMGGSCYDK